MNDKIIKVSNISKLYKMYDQPTDRIKEALSINNKSYHKDFSALTNVSFEISRGENVGIIGKNGSGKSTLLKIITGIINPSHGKIAVLGRVSAILELGSGFNPEYNGIENIYNYGLLMGITRGEMDDKLKEIIEFADLGGFINQAVKTYSSGMYARLAFSVAININPDLLIVDEALSVGDMGFQHKCMNKMKDLIDQGVTVLFVSHDTFAIKSLCSRCIYLENGRIKADGNAIEVTDMYLMDTRKKIYTAEAEEINTINQTVSSELEKKEGGNVRDNNQEKNIYEESRYGTGGVRVNSICMRNSNGDVSDHFEFGEIMSIEINLSAYERIENLNCCIRIRDKNGIDVTGTTSFEENIEFPTISNGDELSVIFNAPNLLKHDMTFSIGITINDTKNIADQVILDHIDLAYTFKSVYNPKRPVWYTYYQDFDIKYKVGKSEV